LSGTSRKQSHATRPINAIPGETERLPLAQAGEDRELDQISEGLVLALAARGQELDRLFGFEPAQPALRFFLQLDLRHGVEHAPLEVKPPRRGSACGP